MPTLPRVNRGCVRMCARGPTQYSVVDTYRRNRVLGCLVGLRLWQPTSTVERLSSRLKECLTGRDRVVFTRTEMRRAGSVLQGGLSIDDIFVQAKNRSELGEIDAATDHRLYAKVRFQLAEIEIKSTWKRCQ
jgi:hypothetical protein